MSSIKRTVVDKRKASLIRKLKELSRTTAPRNEIQIENEPDPADLRQSGVNQEFAVTRLNRQANSISDVQAAIAKIKENVYGACEQCEKPIPAKRLNAVPWARLCVACQSKAEASLSRKRTSANAAA